MNTHTSKLLLAAATLVAASSAHATDFTWKGATNLDWNTASNWNPANIPDVQGERAVFDGTGTNSVTFVANVGSPSSGVAGVGGILVKAAQTSALSINNIATTGTQSFRLVNNSGITIEAGAGAFSMGTSGGNFSLGLSSTATGTPAVSTFQNNSSNTATLGSKITSVGGGSGALTDLRLDGSGNWQVDMTYSNITAGSKLTKNGSGTATLTAANAYVGATAVNAGTLKIASTGSIRVNAAGVTVASGATLAVDGKLVLTSTTQSLIANSGGTIQFNAGSSVLDLNNLFNSATAGQTYTLFSGGGATGNFSGFTNYTGALHLSFDSTDGKLSFTAVPEPSTYGLIGAGALAAGALVRRRRKLVGKAA